MKNLTYYCNLISNKDIKVIYARHMRHDNIEYTNIDVNNIYLIFVNHLFFKSIPTGEHYVTVDDVTMMKINDNVYFVTDSLNYNKIRNYYYAEANSTVVWFERNDERFVDYFKAFALLNNYDTEKLIVDIKNAVLKIKVDKAVEEMCKDKIIETDTLLKKIKNCEVDIKNYKNYMIEQLRKRDEYMALIKIDKNELLATMHKEIYNIANHKKVTSFTVNDTHIIVNTTDLYIREPINNKRYYLGKMEIKIPFSKTGEFYLKNLTEEKMALWKPSQHPHVNDIGEPCYGDVDVQIVEYQGNKQYYAMFLTLLGFLETVNIEDSAGAYIEAWDEVDEEGNVIKKGVEHRKCYRCDAMHPRTEMHQCADCDRWICDDCSNEIHHDGDTYYLCDRCMNSDYFQCTSCNRHFHVDERNTVNGEEYCEECYNNLEDEDESEEE